MSDVKKSIYPLQSILKSVGNPNTGFYDSSTRIFTTDYASPDQQAWDDMLRDNEKENIQIVDKNERELREGEEIKEFKSPEEIERMSNLSEYQLGSESFYGESLLGLGFDNLGLDPDSAGMIEPASSYFRASPYRELEESPLPTKEEKQSLSSSTRSQFEQKVLLASNPKYDEEELAMKELAAFVLSDAGIVETNSSDEEDGSRRRNGEISSSPFNMSFEDLSIYNYAFSSPEDQSKEAPGTGSTSNYTEESSRSSTNFIQTPPLTSGCTSIISIPSPPVPTTTLSTSTHLALQSHPDSPVRDFQFNQSFIPKSPPTISSAFYSPNSNPNLPKRINERRFSQSVQIEEGGYNSDEISPMTTDYSFPDPRTVSTFKSKSSRPPLHLAIQSVKNDDLPAIPSTSSTSTNQVRDLISPTSDGSTPSLLLTSSSGSSSSVLTPKYNSNSTLATTVPGGGGFFDIISDYKGLDRIPAYDSVAASRRPNKIPPLSSELIASIVPPTNISKLRNRNSNQDDSINRYLIPSRSQSHSSPSSPYESTFPSNINNPNPSTTAPTSVKNKFQGRARNFSEPIIPHSIVVFPIFVPTNVSTFTPLTPPLSTSNEQLLPLPTPESSSTSTLIPPPSTSTLASIPPFTSPILKSPVLSSLIKDDFQPLPMNSPSQVVIGSPQGSYSPTGEVFAPWGSVTGIDFRSANVEGETVELEVEEKVSKVVTKEEVGGEALNRSQSSSGSSKEISTEDDEPLAKKPGALRLQKSLREFSKLSSSGNGKKFKKDSINNISNPISQDPSKPIIPRSMMMHGIDDMPLAMVAEKYGTGIPLTISTISLEDSNSTPTLSSLSKVAPTRPQRSPQDLNNSLMTSPTSIIPERQNSLSRESSISRHSGSGNMSTHSITTTSNPSSSRSNSNHGGSNHHLHQLHQQHQLFNNQHTQHHHQLPPALNQPPRRPSRSLDPLVPPTNTSTNTVVNGRPLNPTKSHVELRSPVLDSRKSHSQLHQPSPVLPTTQEFNAIPHISSTSGSQQRKSSTLPTLPTLETTSPLSPKAPSTTASLSPPTSPNPTTPVPLFTRAAANILSSSEHRIFVLDHTTHFVVKVSAATRCGEIVMGAKSRGLLNSGSEAEGGFALWEICRGLGVERAIREFESLADVIASWNNEINILVIRRTILFPILSVYARSPKISVSKSAFVQLEIKKGKWAKRYLELKNGAVFHSKAENGKDFTLLCQLSAFDVFYVAQHTLESLKAPKPFVFVLKSLLPKAHYEDVADYCYYISVKTEVELQSWVKILTEARNVFVRQREQILISNRAEAGLAQATTATISPNKLLENMPNPLPRNNPPPPLSRPVDPPTSNNHSTTAGTVRKVSRERETRSGGNSFFSFNSSKQ